MTFGEISIKPIPLSSHPGQHFERFLMIDVKFRVANFPPPMDPARDIVDIRNW